MRGRDSTVSILYKSIDIKIQKLLLFIIFITVTIKTSLNCFHMCINSINCNEKKTNNYSNNI